MTDTPKENPGFTRFSEALLKATELELAWRIAFNKAASDLLDNPKGTLDMTATNQAEAAYMASLVDMHQTAKQWIVDTTTRPTGGN